MISASSHVSTRPCRRSQARRRAAARHAFTLLELLLVLAILVVLGGIVAVNVVGTGQAANVDATTTQLKMLQQNIDMYQIRMNGLPETLEQLRDGPSDAAKKAKWVAPIITEIPKDAWGNELNYTVNGNSYELRSAGIDGQMSTEDDITVTP
ncbi:prepilin-type N-terminal cleavage/methylation domain-containing protein [Roseiconus nitratireducens]|uniref:Prepilin-type N-terminal cleavage/methylation domain-containing protein n=1 Tax=Roseiconus nitratireducens TaxID=2605748 RepID=A0A5M6DB89_9BACT|nr:type II secretion system protein GspG [Roseiconus nitratireducens]KAA5543660.1 prepilin-type N-terminal cleavage/methylation domain-containing protein [Roseiconus nitratireducens]